MKKIFVLLAIVAFTGTMAVTAVRAMDKESVIVTNNLDENVLRIADQGVQPTDSTNPECTKKAEKKCSADCTKPCCAKKESCKKKQQ